jgi:hypothetical protein
MWKIIVFVILVIAAIYIVPRSGKSTDIEQKGKELSITVGKHRLTASIVGRQIRNSFLVIGGSCKGDVFFTSFFSVIPLDTAERLARRYGNFFTCNSPGASEGKRSIKSMLLYAANHDVEQRLRGIDKLAMASKKPIIEMTYVELRINSHKVTGQEIPILFDSNMHSFLVKDVQIIEEDRNF